MCKKFTGMDTGSNICFKRVCRGDIIEVWFIRSFIRSLTHSFTQSFTHSFIPTLTAGSTALESHSMLHVSRIIHSFSVVYAKSKNLIQNNKSISIKSKNCEYVKNAGKIISTFYLSPPAFNFNKLFDPVPIKSGRPLSARLTALQHTSSHLTALHCP